MYMGGLEIKKKTCQTQTFNTRTFAVYKSILVRNLKLFL